MAPLEPPLQGRAALKIPAQWLPPLEPAFRDVAVPHTLAIRPAVVTRRASTCTLLAPATDCDFAASVTRASGLGLRFKTADCRRGGCLTPPIPAVSIPLHCRAASEP